MAVPTLIREAMRLHGSQTGVPADSDCQGAKHHSPRPLVLHEIEAAHGQVLLCGTCKDNLSTLLHLKHEHSGVLSWGLRREFGNQIRALAGC